MSAHTGRLLLSAHDPFLVPDRVFLAKTLTEAGFLGAPLAGREDAFAVGERFLQMVTFAGCSVQIDLSPAGGAPFCHVRLAGPFETPVFLSGRNTRPPRCRRCRRPLRDWKNELAVWVQRRGSEIACPTCGEASPPWAYDWKDTAGFGRLFIRIEEVFPGEAVPTPSLTDLLERCTGCMWRYFYIQDG